MTSAMEVSKKLERSAGTKVPPEYSTDDGRPHGREVGDGPHNALFAVREKRMLPARSVTGRTELICMYCDKLDPFKWKKLRSGQIALWLDLFAR